MIKPGTAVMFLSGVQPTPDEWLHGTVVEWTSQEWQHLPAIRHTHYCIEVSPVHYTNPRRVFRKYEDVKNAANT